MTVETEGYSDSPIMLGPSPEPDETPAAAPVETPAPADPAPTPTPEPEHPEQPKQPAWMQKRFDELTRKRYEESEARQAAEKRAEDLAREAASLRELLKQGGTPTDPALAPGKVYNETELRAEADRIANERIQNEQKTQAEAKFNERCNTVFEEGVKKFGAPFQSAVANLNMAGVADRDFIDAALETQSPAAVLHHLGQNPDEAIKIAALSPIRKAVELDRLAARLMAAPKPNPISNAPPPIAPVAGDRAKDGVDIYDPEADDAAWFAEMEKRDRAR